MIRYIDSPAVSLNWSRRSFLRAAMVGACAVSPLAMAFQTPLQIPAMHSSLIARSPLLDVACLGKRIVAAGVRGGILFSDDTGQSWKQAQVPVSTDLVALAFPSAALGWAVGHGGVVLHTEDGGQTWGKQLDGAAASKLAIDYYESNSATVPEAGQFLERERSLAVEGETQPFMDVFFVDERRGYVVGTFNRIFMTEDGGQSWQPQMHLTENPGELHFYSVCGIDDQLYLAGEQGKVWRRDSASGRFVAADTPYSGTLFGVLPCASDLLFAYGMRGSFYRSTDRGASWEKIQSPTQGGITTALALSDGRVFIADQSGGVAISKDSGRHFTALKVANPMAYAGASVLSENAIVMVGALGVRIETV
ncbi:YCF48-related protein [Pseudomonas brassicacearum]|nr:YCF48-related protein [Pseudomonas brassicacearum]